MTDTIEKHFVTFASPGTIFSETTERQIDSWDVDKAVQMARNITERHAAKPYGFYFTTRTRGPEDLDSKVTATSPLYYLGGHIETRDEVEARNDPKEEILRSNMRANDIDRIIINNNSWRFTAALKPTDIVLDVDLTVERTDA